MPACLSGLCPASRRQLLFIAGFRLAGAALLTKACACFPWVGACFSSSAGLHQLLSRILQSPTVVGNAVFLNTVSRIDGVTALWAAANEGHTACVRALLAASVAVESAVRANDLGL